MKKKKRSVDVQTRHEMRMKGKREKNERVAQQKEDQGERKRRKRGARR